MRHESELSLLMLTVILISVKPIKSTTFQNVQITLTSTNDITLRKNVYIYFDNNIKKYIETAIKGVIVNEVTIDRQNISKLERSSITDLLEVTNLHLVDCGIKEIEPKAFRNLPKLKELSLENNLLTEIRNGVFENIYFDTLYLNNNHITRIEDRAFNNLQMEFLFIDNNRISFWDSRWFNGTPLTSISIRNNLLKVLPKRSFEYLWKFTNMNLVYFIADNNNLKYIDPNAFEGLKEISHLSLQNNVLEYLEPGMFDSVRRIQFLELSFNKIKELYYETFRYTNLQKINVRNNKLNCISTDIFLITHLDQLFIDGNPVTCECIQSWEEWNNKGKKLEIDNFHKVKKNCYLKSKANKFKTTMFVFFTICILIL